VEERILTNDTRARKHIIIIIGNAVAKKEASRTDSSDQTRSAESVYQTAPGPQTFEVASMQIDSEVCMSESQDSGRAVTCALTETSELWRHILHVQSFQCA
jgi:hypothetical protein